MVDPVLMPITLEGVDFSGYFKYRQQDETLRKVYGPHAGRVTLDATEWTDLLGNKYDLTATTLPMGPDKLADLREILELDHFELTTFSWWKNEIWTREVIVDGASAILAMIVAAGSRPVLANFPIKFREK